MFVFFVVIYVFFIYLMIIFLLYLIVFFFNWFFDCVNIIINMLFNIYIGFILFL